MSAILKFDFQKRKQLRSSEVNYLNLKKKKKKKRKKDSILHVTTTFCLKQGETRTTSGPIRHSLRCIYIIFQKGVDINFERENKTCLFLVRGAVPP